LQQVSLEALLQLASFASLMQQQLLWHEVCLKMNHDHVCAAAQAQA
jgi:hypothetical protein